MTIQQEQPTSDLGFEKLDSQEYPDDFYTGYDIKQEIKRQFNLKE